MNVLIVDDEPLAVELIEAYVQKLPTLKLVATCGNALEAISVLNKHSIDLMFLDINMPEITGMDLLKMLKDPPKVILTTAYTEYAAESYNFNVVDYLVKPISFERFMKAVHKLTEQPTVETKSAQEDVLWVRSEGKMIQVDLQQLQLVEGYKNYVRLWTSTGKIIVHNTMKNFEEYLGQYSSFVRIHKSYIVNMAYISELSGNYVKIGTEHIAIGAAFRENMDAVLKKYKQL